DALGAELPGGERRVRTHVEELVRTEHRFADPLDHTVVQQLERRVPPAIHALRREIRLRIVKRVGEVVASLNEVPDRVERRVDLGTERAYFLAGERPAYDGMPGCGDR